MQTASFIMADLTRPATNENGEQGEACQSRRRVKQGGQSACSLVAEEMQGTVE